MSERDMPDDDRLYDVAKEVTEEFFGPDSWVDPRPSRRRFDMQFGQRKTLADLNPEDFKKAVQHIPHHLVKKHGSNMLEVEVFNDPQSAQIRLYAVTLPDESVEAVQPTCMHVCLN